MGNTHSSLPAYYNADPTNSAGAHALSGYVNLASEAIGSKVVRASNEKFGAARNLIKVQAPAPRGEAKEGGYDAWVTRRHNTEADWAVIRLGSPGSVAGFDIDTRGLDGEHATQVSIQGCLAHEGAAVDAEGAVEDAEWAELLPAVEIAADARHLLALWTPTDVAYSHVRVRLHPDGGLARLRVLGTVAAPETTGEVDLASVHAGARVVSASDEKLGAKENLILPGPAEQSEPATWGWKTRRSHAPADRCDWAIVRLGEPGFLTRIELDTGVYDGDQPVAAAVQACYSLQADPERDPQCFWYQIVPRTELNASTLHTIEVSLNDVPFSHIKLLVYPDGGISRLRAFGQRVTEIEEEAAREEAEAAAEALLAAETGLDAVTPVEPDTGDVSAVEAADADTEEAPVAEQVTAVVEETVSVVQTTPKKTKVAAVAQISEVARTPPRKKDAKGSKKQVPRETEADDAEEHFSSREGELIQSLTSPLPARKRANTRSSRAEEETDEGSVAEAAQPKRTRRKPKNRNASTTNA
ncbi:Allantoicase [Coemansia sp. Benny D115]|nr:Allantoicase [Coemansia sp. Benny D115]